MPLQWLPWTLNTERVSLGSFRLLIHLMICFSLRPGWLAYISENISEHSHIHDTNEKNQP